MEKILKKKLNDEELGEVSAGAISIYPDDDEMQEKLKKKLSNPRETAVMPSSILSIE